MISHITVLIRENGYTQLEVKGSDQSVFDGIHPLGSDCNMTVEPRLDGAVLTVEREENSHVITQIQSLTIRLNAQLDSYTLMGSRRNDGVIVAFANTREIKFERPTSTNFRKDGTAVLYYNHGENDG